MKSEHSLCWHYGLPPAQCPQAANHPRVLQCAQWLAFAPPDMHAFFQLPVDAQLPFQLWSGVALERLLLQGAAPCFGVWFSSSFILFYFLF
jgi:hypothetical protein